MSETGTENLLRGGQAADAENLLRGGQAADTDINDATDINYGSSDIFEASREDDPAKAAKKGAKVAKVAKGAKAGKAGKASKAGKGRTGRRKRRKGWIVLVLIILAVAGFFVFRSLFNKTVTAQQVRFTAITRGDLKDTVSVKGNVESDVRRNVYSTLGLTVKAVEVSVGDFVKEGQLLCQLDSDDLKLNLEQQNADLNASIKSSDLQIESNEKIYSDAAENLRSGSNAQILNAEASVKNAQISLDNAQTNYNNLQNDYNNGTNANRKSAESAVASAKNDLDTRERDYETNKLLLAAGAITQDALTQSQNVLNTAQMRYDDALTSLENANVAETRALEQSRGSLRSAQTAYNNALTALDTAKNTAEQELERYGTNVETSKAGANIESRLIAIKKLEKQLADSDVKSPVDGVVTAVYAKEGGSGAGLLFVIEDPAQLSVKVRVKEYDAGKLSPGMPVIIQSDAISNTKYAGTLTSIEPAAVKNAAGDTDTLSDIEFGARVSVDSPGSLLRIGMTSRLDIIVEEQDNVFFVPFDAIATNGDGQTVVYAIEDTAADGQGAGTDDEDDGPAPGAGAGAAAYAMEIPIETGLETDFYVEIYGPGLYDGLRVINEASDSNLYDGAPVSYQNGSAGGGLRMGNFGRTNIRIG